LSWAAARDRELMAKPGILRSMPRDRTEVIRSMYAGFSGVAQGGDVASYVREHWDPECEYLPVEEHGAIRGHDELIRWTARWFETWEEFETTIDELVESDDVVFTGITIRGRGGESGGGIDVSQRIFHVIDVRDGRIVRMREFGPFERDEAVEAAGLTHPG
jgi:ketosteroid isomerase-like protein